jgi:hypothetical protein
MTLSRFARRGLVTAAMVSGLVVVATTAQATPGNGAVE